MYCDLHHWRMSPFLYSWLYWTDWGDTARIQRASMDGQNIETVHNQSTSIRRPQALTIDYDSQTLYWSDQRLHKILWSQMEPGSPINISSYSILTTYSMVIFGSYLFSTNDLGVQSRNVDGTELHYLYLYSNSFYDTCKSIHGIDIISEQRQAQSELINVYPLNIFCECGPPPFFTPRAHLSLPQYLTPVKSVMEDVELLNYVC